MGKSGFDILFTTARFNVSEPRDYFINDCCFGDDAARWLVKQQRSHGWNATDPDQEDWGWYFDVRREPHRWFVGVGGLRDENASQANQGEWRLMVEKHRSLLEKLTGGNRMQHDDPLLDLLQQIITNEPDLTFSGIE